MIKRPIHCSQSDCARGLKPINLSEAASGQECGVHSLLSITDLLRGLSSYVGHNWAFTRYDRRTDRSVRLVGPTGRMKRLHVPIVGTTGRPEPGYIRLVCQTSRTSNRPHLSIKSMWPAS